MCGLLNAGLEEDTVDLSTHWAHGPSGRAYSQHRGEREKEGREGEEGETKTYTIKNEKNDWKGEEISLSREKGRLWRSQSFIPA